MSDLADVWEQKIAPLLATTASGCWEFQGGGRSAGGYGRIWFGGRMASVTRIAAAIHHGLDRSDRSLHVCHTCDNPPCCNPAHIFVGTASDNARDAIAKGRRLRLPPGALPRAVCDQGHDKQGRSKCPECERVRHREYMREYRKHNREHIAAYNREYRKRKQVQAQ